MEQKVRKIVEAWEKRRPEKTFGGMGLEEFKEKVQPVFETRAEIAQLERQLAEALRRRAEADRAASALISLVVSAVRCAPEEGDDSELYGAMGYVRKSRRKKRGPSEGASHRRAAAPVHTPSHMVW
jgi:hypothetical protein